MLVSKSESEVYTCRSYIIIVHCTNKIYFEDVYSHSGDTFHQLLRAFSAYIILTKTGRAETDVT